MTENSKHKGPYKDERFGIRVYVLRSERHLIRMAAAAREMSMAEFCRQVAVKEAALEMKVELPAEEAAPPPRKRGRPRKGG